MYKQLIKECVKLNTCYNKYGFNAFEDANIYQLQQLLQCVDHEKLKKYIKLNLAQINIESKLQYINLLQGPYDSYSIGIFILSQNQKMPLHDHPHMIVASKILCGNATLMSFDIDSNNKDNIQMKFPLKHYSQGLCRELVRLKRLPDKSLSAGDIHWTRPSDSNIHQFSNIGDSIFAFIDVLIPNYDFKSRFCNFYEESSEPGQFFITGFPDDYQMDNLDLNIDLDNFFIK